MSQEIRLPNYDVSDTTRCVSQRRVRTFKFLPPSSAASTSLVDIRSNDAHVRCSDAPATAAAAAAASGSPSLSSGRVNLYGDLLGAM
jgi:hypothetical protein